MAIPTSEKTKAKKRIMRELEPWLTERGFTKKPGFEYYLDAGDGDRLIMILNVPTFDTFYRVFSRWESAKREFRVEGPQSFPFECPNHPGKKRYNFRFHLSEQTHLRCSENLKEWMTEVLLPWFDKRPKTSWINPNAI